MLNGAITFFWSYLERAEKHRDKLESNKNKIYVEWAQTYLSEEYRSLVEELRKIIDEQAHFINFEEATKIFRLACKYKYLFWDMAYRTET